MQIQSVNYQPNFEGKVIGKGVMLLKDSHWDVPAGMDKNACIEIPDNLLNKMREMVKDKNYDVFISPNKNNTDFINVDANTSFENVQNGIQGRIKVNRNIFEAFPQAMQDAMDLFEEHLTDLKNKANFLKKESV